MLLEKKKAVYLTYPQDKFIFSKHHFTCLKGTWGCGKSMAGLKAANKECEELPGNLYLIIRKEYVDMRDSTMKDWDRWIGRQIVSNDVRYENGSILMFRHGSDLNALKNANLGGALMVQAEEMTEDDFWFLNGRLRREDGSRQLRLECNYDGHNWIYDLFNLKKTGTLITTNTFDNEANLPSDYIPNLKMLPERLQKRHLYGSDDIGEGLVWPEFEEDKHACESFEFPREWKKAFGLDHGHDHPTAVLFGGSDYDGRIIIYDEHYEKGKPISYHADMIKAIEPDYYGLDQIIDHTCRFKTMQSKERVYSIIEAYADYGLHFRPSPSDALGGINMVAELFKAGRILIFKDKAPNLIREIKNWKWKQPKPGMEKFKKEEAVRIDEDACKALIYLCSGYFPTPELPKVEKPGMTEEKYLDLVEQQEAFNKVAYG